MLVSLDDIKIYLGIDPSNTDHDAFLTQQEKAAAAMIDTYCGRHFAYLENWAELITNPTKTLNLLRFPIVSVSSIEGEYAILTPDQYAIDSVNGRIISKFAHHGGQCCWEYYNAVTVTYTGGYTEETLPADLQAVLLDMIAARYYNQGADISKPVKSEKVDGIGSTTFAINGNGPGMGGFGNFGVEQYSGVLDLYRIETVLAQ